MYQYILAVLPCLVVSWFWSKSRPDRMPPGPLCYPIVNNIPSMSLNEKFAETMKKLHIKYGPIISVSLLGRGVWDIWIQGYDVTKEVLHDPRFSTRSVVGILQEMNFDKGLAWASNDVAKSKRKVMVQIMRTLGVGKSSFADGVEKEIKSMLQHFEKQSHQPIFIQVKTSTIFSFDRKIYSQFVFRVSLLWLPTT